MTVNSEFIIRVYPALKGKKGTNSLITFNQLKELVGDDMGNDIIDKAYEKGLDTFTKKLRRGIKIELTGR